MEINTFISPTSKTEKGGLVDVLRNAEDYEMKTDNTTALKTWIDTKNT